MNQVGVQPFGQRGEPFGPMRVLRFIQDFQGRTGQWPTLAELIEVTGRDHDEVFGRLNNLTGRKWLVKVDGGRFCPTEIAPEFKPYTSEQWTPEQIAARLKSLERPKYNPWTASDLPQSEPTIPCTAAPEIIHPPAPPPTVITVAPDPAPVNLPAQEEVHEPMPVAKYVWPSDPELVKMADEIQARNGKLGAEMAALLNVPEKRISGRLATARLNVRQGIARPVKGHSAAIAQAASGSQALPPVVIPAPAPAPAVQPDAKKPAWDCAFCGDTGYAGAPEDGVFCLCDAGSRENRQYYAAMHTESPQSASSAPIATAPQPARVAEPLPTQPTGQGDCTPVTSDGSNGPVAPVTATVESGALVLHLKDSVVTVRVVNGGTHVELSAVVPLAMLLEGRVA